MKKKILAYVILTIVFVLTITTSVYIVIANYNNIQNAKITLKHYNKIIKILVDNQNINYDELPKINGKVRITVIDVDGTVLYDNMNEVKNLDNHNDRIEVIKAKENGEGVEVRFSETSKGDLVYSAVKLKDGKIIRTAISVTSITVMYSGYMGYYILALVCVFIISALLSLRLISAIIGPIRELEFVSSRIAKGEFHIRAKNNSNDELGNLASSFNKMAEELQITISEAKEEENRLKAIVKSMDSGVIALDKERKILIMNPYAKKIFGIKENVIGKYLVDVIIEFDLNNVIFDKNSNLHEIKILNPEKRELRVRCADVKNDHGMVIGKVAVLQDLTDIRNLEKMRSEFVANVSHELKTPVTSIKGFAETLKDVDDLKIREKFLNIIDEESERLTRLIDDIMTLSNIETKGIILEERFNPKEEIEIAYNLLKNISNEKNIELILDSNIEAILIGDRFRFRQMIINIIDNALKYTEAYGCVKVSSNIEDDYYIINIKDTGIGIPKEDLGRIFERFYRVDKARSRKKGGTGLGLAIVKHIVKSFNGEIYVESREGIGTRFTIKIKRVNYK